MSDTRRGGGCPRCHQRYGKHTEDCALERRRVLGFNDAFRIPETDLPVPPDAHKALREKYDVMLDALKYVVSQSDENTDGATLVIVLKAIEKALEKPG